MGHRGGVYCVGFAHRLGPDIAMPDADSSNPTGQVRPASMPGRHVPVLTAEIVEVLAPKPGQVYADATAGLGGHAAIIARLLGPSGTVILNDLDMSNLVAAEANVRAACGDPVASPRILAVHGNFAELPRKIASVGVGRVGEGAGAEGRANLVLADLGFASNQIESAERGFSFMRDGPLDMRLNPQQPLSAADLVASMSEAELAGLIRDFGEDPAARRIAQAIVEARREEPIRTTLQLAEIVRRAIRGAGARGGGGGRSKGATGIDPATRTFQALRIAVNDELGSLDAFLAAIERAATRLARSGGGAGKAGPIDWLAPGARIAIISFHSQEDRRVKQAFGRLADAGLARELSKGPIEAGEAEVRENPRSRSAKLRAIELALSPAISSINRAG